MSELEQLPNDMIPAFRQNFLEAVKHTLYDTEDLVGKTRRVNLFVSPVGMRSHSGRMKEMLHTNMEMGAMMPAPCKFMAQRLSILFRREGRPLKIAETPLYAE